METVWDLDLLSENEAEKGIQELMQMLLSVV